MSSNPLLLDYARPPALRGWPRYVARLLLSFFASAWAGGLIGFCFSWLLLGPTYQSDGRIYLEHDPPAKILLATYNRVKSPPIVSAALIQAMRGAGKASLPPSASEALRHLKISFSRFDDAVEVAYQSRDPAAAVCMVRGMIDAYAADASNPQNGQWQSFRVSRPLACEILEVGDADGPCESCGDISGVALFACWALIRSQGPQ